MDPPPKEKKKGYYVPLFFKRGHRERKFRSMNTHVYVQAINSCMFQSFSLFRRALLNIKYMFVNQIEVIVYPE